MLYAESPSCMWISSCLLCRWVQSAPKQIHTIYSHYFSYLFSFWSLTHSPSLSRLQAAFMFQLQGRYLQNQVRCTSYRSTTTAGELLLKSKLSPCLVFFGICRVLSGLRWSLGSLEMFSMQSATASSSTCWIWVLCKCTDHREKLDDRNRGSLYHYVYAFFSRFAILYYTSALHLW